MYASLILGMVMLSPALINVVENLMTNLFSHYASKIILYMTLLCALFTLNLAFLYQYAPANANIYKMCSQALSTHNYSVTSKNILKMAVHTFYKLYIDLIFKLNLLN